MTKEDWVSLIREAIVKSQEPWEILATANTRDDGYEVRLWNARSGSPMRFGMPAVGLPGFEMAAVERASVVNALASSLASH